MKIKGSIALVTGASSGIGEAIAKRLATAGYKVCGTSRRGVQSGQRPFAMLPLDVTGDASVEAAVKELIRQEGRIDLLVNNAGFGVAPAGAEESSIDQAKAIFETNFFGLVRMTRAVVPHMRRQASGRIVNIGSVLGFLPMPYGALYSATKHAVEGYSESLDHELRTRGIRVCVIEAAYSGGPARESPAMAAQVCAGAAARCGDQKGPAPRCQPVKAFTVDAPGLPRYPWSAIRSRITWPRWRRRRPSSSTSSSRATSA